MNVNKNVTIKRMKELTELHGAPGFENDVNII